MYTSFGHLGGYSSAYYTYFWDKVIPEDFFMQFDHDNLLAGAAPMRYRRVVLEPGGSMSANELVRNFLGGAEHGGVPTMDGRRIRARRSELEGGNRRSRQDRRPPSGQASKARKRFISLSNVCSRPQYMRRTL